MFKIIKKGSNNFWHVFNDGAKNVSISDFEVVLDDVLNTFVIVLRNGANIPQIALSVLDIIVIDETASSVEETFLTASQLRARLVVLGYTAYLGAGNADSITGLISDGTNVTITGSGTLADPYVISSSGGSGTTPTLQEVTTEGNYTPIDIQIDYGNGASLKFVDGQDNVLSTISANGGLFIFNDESTGNSFTTDSSELSGGDKILATREWTTDQIPTTPDEVGALAIDGSNANVDVDLSAFGIRAGEVVTQTNGTTKKMTLKSTNVNTDHTAEWQDKDYTAIADVSDITDALATFKTDEFLDATSSIQTQLDSKQSLLTYIPYKFVQTSQTAHTGTTAKTIVATATITANSFSVSDVAKAIFGINKPATTSAYTIRLDINTSNTLSGATTIATFTGSATAQVAVMTRKYSLFGGDLYGYPFTTSQLSDSAALLAGTLGSTAFDTTNTIYMFWTIQLVNSADSVTPNLATLSN